MRQIKFRVWDTSYKKFIPSEYIELNWDGEVVSVYDDGRDVMDANPNKDAVLMQFTGLQDRNGKDIYEGDIVRHRFMGDKIVHGEVTIHPTQGVKVGNWPISFDYEVIGNIYENPELLEATV